MNDYPLGGAMNDHDLKAECVMCKAVTDDWVVWGAAFVEEVYYFCANDCLMQWLLRLKAGSVGAPPAGGVPRRGKQIRGLLQVVAEQKDGVPRFSSEEILD